MSRFLHIVPDDKFIDAAVDFYAELGGEHMWLSLSEKGVSEFTYIKSSLVDIVCYTKLEEIVEKGLYDVVVFHTLYSQMFSVVLKVPNDKTVIWNSWGADIYYNNGCLDPLLKIDLYKGLTKRYLINEKLPIIKRIKRLLLPVLMPKRAKERSLSLKEKIIEQEHLSALRQQAIARVNLCSTILEIEFKELSKLPFFSAGYFPFKYVTNKKGSNYPVCNGNYLLVGNSRDPSNNHLDVLDYLDKQGISSTRIVPVSYGDYRTLQVLRKQYGHDKRVLLITDFLNRSEYFELINKCNVAVFGHIRQQALGNINRCLRQGTKVFLYKDSMVYRYYRDLGITVFSIEDDLNLKSLEKGLDYDIVERNRRLLAELWNYNVVMSRVRKVLGSQGILL